MDTEEPSRGDQLIEDLKASPRANQFRLIDLFGMMLLLSILLTIPRIIGITYKWYFQFLSVILYGCTPFVAWVLANVLPRALGRIRVLIAVVVAAAIVLPFWTLTGWYDGSYRLILALCATLLLFWLPQIVCITLVWYFLFRSTSGHRRQ